MDFDALYEILVIVAKLGRRISYTRLSELYRDYTSKRIDPRSGWDVPLAELDQMLDTVGLAPLSAVVMIKATGEPGVSFWGGSPNTPARPPNDAERADLYKQILGEVYATRWPTWLPGGRYRAPYIRWFPYGPRLS